VAYVEKLVRAAADADPRRGADAGDLRLERAFAVEDLNAVVARVGDVNIAVGVAGDAADPLELALAGAGVAPGLQEVAVLVELGDAVVGAEAVGDVDVPGAIPGDVRRPVEAVAVDARARRAGAAA